MMDGVPKDHNSQLPPPALSGLVSPPANRYGARPDQQHGITFEELPFEAACRGERARSLTVSAPNTPTTTPRIASTTDASSDCGDDDISGFHGPNWQPQHKTKQAESALAPRRVLRPRVNPESNRPDRRPPIAVVIPVRRSPSLMIGVSTDSLSQPPRRPHQDSAGSAVEEDRRTDTTTKKHSRLIREAAVHGEDRSQKKCRRDLHLKEAARYNPACTRHHDHDTGSMGVSQHPSGVDLPTSPRHWRFSVAASSVYSRMARGARIFLHSFQMPLIIRHVMSDPGRHLTGQCPPNTPPSHHRRRVLSAKGVGNWPATGPRMGGLTPKLGIVIQRAVAILAKGCRGRRRRRNFWQS